MIASLPIVQVNSVADIQDVLLRGAPVQARGGGTKPALTVPAPGVTTLDMTPLAGILEYEPAEYTFTARAGTRVRDVTAALAEHGQYMPFDPPLAEAGATLGGTVAAGLSGSGRYRYGGVRDFLIGVRFVDGVGRLVRGGGKVVKNAAGFDLPKLMVGSLGRYGILVEMSFKVFPQPRTYATVRAGFGTLAAALDGLHKLTNGPYDLEALDLTLPSAAGPATLWVRLGGWEDALPARVARLCTLLGAGELVASNTEAALWHDLREFAWVPVGAALVKVPVTPAVIPALEQRLNGVDAPRRYIGGGNLAWVAWRGPLQDLSATLATLTLSGLVIRGSTPRPEIGGYSQSAFGLRVQQALDPNRLFHAKATAG
jgi:glycolate oxidase FAD binding subunit